MAGTAAWRPKGWLSGKRGQGKQQKARDGGVLRVPFPGSSLALLECS